MLQVYCELYFTEEAKKIRKIKNINNCLMEQKMKKGLKKFLQEHTLHRS